VLGLLGEWEKNRFEIFRSLTLLRQLSLHAGLVDESNIDVGSAKVDFVVEQLTELVAEGHSALVFSQFTRFLGILRSHLDAVGLTYSYLDGSLSARERASAIAAFREGSTRVFLISLKAGGFGLNLTEADYCFVCDPWWSPAAEAQAIDRTHRIGQTRPVTVYRLVSEGTIEERVVALQERKRELFTAVVDERGGAGVSHHRVGYPRASWVGPVARLTPSVLRPVSRPAAGRDSAGTGSQRMPAQSVVARGSPGPGARWPR
jgi:SNF2 family DNA or RNA helicase